MNIVVYAQPACQPCSMTKRQLSKLGVEHDVIDVSVNPEAAKVCVGLGYQTTPVVVVRDSSGELTEHWSGFRPDKLRSLVS